MRTLELRVPPVLVVVLAGFLMTAVDRLLQSAEFSFPGRVAISMALIVIGILVAVAGVVAFRQHDTTVDPVNPGKAQSLVTSGIYRISRNPMYLGFLISLMGWGAYLSNLAALLFLPAFVLYMNRFQIEPEERFLASKFGASFDAYANSVRRWI